MCIRDRRWADPETGHSPNFWGRSIGWWFMALVDALEYIPQEHSGYADMAAAAMFLGFGFFNLRITKEENKIPKMNCKKYIRTRFYF